MNQQNMIPPYVESTFHQILGVRNAKIADFKITAIKGSPNASDTSENLKTILSELAAMENQLEILVGMFPELEKAMPPPPAPRTNPAPQEPTPQEPKSQEVNPPKSISKEDIEGEETPFV